MAKTREALRVKIEKNHRL